MWNEGTRREDEIDKERQGLIKKLKNHIQEAKEKIRKI